jgi:WD40 repeat protein
VSDVAWNPDQGLHLVTSSGDDKNPVLKLWDLRSSTSLPLATLQGKESIIRRKKNQFIYISTNQSINQSITLLYHYYH